MLKKALFLVCLAVALSLVTPEQASACEDCRPKLRCLNDECFVVDECQAVKPLMTSFEICTVVLGFCSASGDLCRWA